MKSSGKWMKIVGKLPTVVRQDGSRSSEERVLDSICPCEANVKKE
jgi:hypothetical protein